MDLLSTAFLMSKDSIPKDVYEKLEKKAQNIKLHMDVIDCGELSVDDNRYIWDSLEKRHKLIYKLFVAAKKISSKRRH